jgi:hypothetical protein
METTHKLTDTLRKLYILKFEEMVKELERLNAKKSGKRAG